MFLVIGSYLRIDYTFMFENSFSGGALKKLSYRLKTGRQLCNAAQLFSIAVITETYVRGTG